LTPHPKIIDRIIEGIRDSRSICVVGHIRPDGDCVGSQLGLTLALKNEGKRVVCWNEDRNPQKYESRDRDNILQKPKRGMKFDFVIATDAASFERLGTVGPCITNRKLFINIDHHESNTRYADINWVSAREPSTGELIFRLLKIAKWPITRPIADCLFTAVSTDTGSFQYPSTRPGTYHVAGELVRRGANLAKICDEVYQSYPLSRARLRLGMVRMERDWYPFVEQIAAGGRPADAARKRLRETLLASLPLFKAAKFFLNPEMSLADCALAPLIWRLPSLGVELPREARVIDDYGERIFRNPGFTRSLTEEEKALRA